MSHAVAVAASAALRRSATLMRAAAAGAANYHRGRDLRLALRCPLAQRTDVLGKLLEEEARLDGLRMAGEAVYSVARHVLVMSALVAELRDVLASPKAGAPAAAVATREAVPAKGRPRAVRPLPSRANDFPGLSIAA